MPRELERRLRSWRLQKLRALWAEGVVRFLFLMGALLYAGALLDRAFALSSTLRWAVLCAGGVSLAAGLYLHLLGPLGALRSRSVLRAAGKRYPSVRRFLESAWELAVRGAGPNTSPELVREHLRRTEERLAVLPDECAFPWRPSAGASKRLVFIAAAWGLGLPWLQTGGNRFERILAPWRDVRLETLVDVRPGDGTAVWGERVEISARWRDVRDAAGLSLFLRPVRGDWASVPWDRDEGDRFSFTVQSLTSPLEYRVAHRDAFTRSFRIDPLPLPRLKNLAARVRLPGQGPSVREIPLEGGGEVASLRGSWVSLKGEAVEPLSSASLRLSFLGAPVPLKHRGEGVWEGGFPLTENGTLRIDLVSEAGVRDPDPMVYPVKVVEDLPPEAELLSPAFELEISRREVLPVTYEVRDDYGLSSLALVYRAGDGPENILPLKRFREQPTRTLDDHEWDLSGFRVGTRIEFRIRATDNARPDPQTSVSEKGVLRIVDFESVHMAMERRWLGAEAMLGRLADREAAMAALLDELAAGSPEERARKLDAFHAARAALAAQWEQTSSGMEAFSESMRQDPYANPGMAESAQALSRAVKELKEKELPSARSAEGAQEYGQAAEKHRELESRVRRAAEILNAGREVQAMQDLWAEAARMERAGGEIGEALKSMAEGRTASPEDQRKLGEAMGKLREQMERLTRVIEAMPKVDPNTQRGARRKVFTVPLKQAGRTLDALQAAIERGDFQAAARLAEQLAQQLAQVQSSISDAARSMAGSSADSPSRRMKELQDQWQDALKEQKSALSVTQAIEDVKMRQRLQAQQELLKALALEQSAVLAEAAQAGDAVRKDILSWMRRVLEEFERSKVREAPTLLAKSVSGLKSHALRLQALKSPAAAKAPALLGMAERETAILERLSRGALPPPMSEEQMSRTFAASAVQRQASRKSEALESAIHGLSHDFGLLPGDALEALNGARAEQGSAENALRDRATAKALSHQQKAVELLDRGEKSMQQSMRQQQSISRGSMRPFGSPGGVARPAGGRGRTGSDTGFVPLPDAEEYQPPREIRKEVERSLQERRPPAFDDAVNEYLRRMSQ